jgi:hypothetical protein
MPLELLAQLADEDVDDLQFRLVHAAIEMVQEHFLGQRRALAQREQLEHLVFLAGQVHALAADFDGLGVEVDLQIAGRDDRLSMAFRPAHDRMDAGDQLVLVERLGHVVVGAEAETANLVLDPGHAGKDQDRRLDLGTAQRLAAPRNRHVGQVQVQEDDVVIIQLAEIDAFFAQIRGVDVEVSDFSISSMLCS